MTVIVTNFVWELSSLAVILQADAILTIGEEIGTKLAKAEAMGADGNIEESMKLMSEVEELNRAKADAEV